MTVELEAMSAGGSVAGISPGDWLYGVEARRDAHARTLSRAGARVQPPAPAPVVAAAGGRDAKTN